MTKALFLDRDGTINIDRDYVYKIEDFEFIDGIFDFCNAAQSKGYEIIVITNQSGIARGYYGHADFDILNNHMKEQFQKAGVKITDVFYCPHLDKNHKDRKPNPGMFISAQEKYNIDMSNSISVGDKERDIEAALNAGVKTNYLFTDKETTDTKATRVVKNYKELINLI